MRRTVVSVCLAFGVTLIFCSSPGTRSAELNQLQMKVPDNADYTQFRHESSYHARLPCLLCHRRENNSARPSLPGKPNHLPCAGCHVKQFADNSGPICTLCHTSTQSGALRPFPRLNTFSVTFDHARHLRMSNVSCSTCHKPTRGGVAITIPLGFNAHATCFRCHSANGKSGNRDISSCGVCHHSGFPVRPRETAASFGVGFSHAKHSSAEKLACSECHRVRPGVNLVSQVGSPQPLNHHALPNSLSCMSCHNGKRTFGGDDFTACKRCHKGSEWHF